MSWATDDATYLSKFLLKLHLGLAKRKSVLHFLDLPHWDASM